jgi:uncharacterized iron-regulated membrane protein
MTKNRQNKRSRLIRNLRKIHNTSSLYILIFLLIIAVTGILLGVKKHSGGYILADTAQGTTTDLKKWLAADTLYSIACNILHDSVSSNLSTEISRIDMRPSRGTVKFVFENHYWGVQLDGATGFPLKVERRRSDIIENIHTGLILDFFFNTRHEPLKLIYTLTMGLALILMIITGFWLWYLRKQKQKRSDN